MEDTTSPIAKDIMIRLFSIAKDTTRLGGNVFDKPFEIDFTSFQFSGGEIQVQVGPKISFLTSLPEVMRIEADLFSAYEFMELIHAVDALRRRGAKELHLVCKYLPYARQDRVMNHGEALGLKVSCDLINGLNFESVEVWDVHSDTALALLNNVKRVTQTQFVQLIPNMQNAILVAPDAGAAKKVMDSAKGYGRDMVTAEKKRNVKTGEITETKVHSESVGNRDFLILDDICDGGRTFTELAQELRKLTGGKIYLYVTHGIFSKGLTPFEGLIDHIYVANPFPGVDLTNPIISKLVFPGSER